MFTLRNPHGNVRSLTLTGCVLQFSRDVAAFSVSRSYEDDCLRRRNDDGILAQVGEVLRGEATLRA